MKTRAHSKKTKGRTLHVVYFVDSNETKTASFNIRNLKIAFFLAAGFSLLSISAFATLFLLLRHNHIKGNELQELKAAHLAQSIVHENLLKEAPFLVAAKADIILSKQSSQVADALKNGTTVDLNSEELSFAESEQTEAEVTKASQSESSAKTESGEENRQLLPSASPKLPHAQSNIDSEPRVEKSVPQVENQTKGFANNPVSFSQIKAIYSDNESRYLLKFTMQNLQPNAASLDGTLCAVLRGKNASGKPVSSNFPQNFQPEKLSKHSCTDGLRIRFARFRPSEMLIRSEQMNLETITFHLFSGVSHFKEEIKLN